MSTDTLGYGPSTTSQPPRLDPPWVRGLLAVVLLVTVSAPAALFCGFGALIGASGCFIECVEPDPDPVAATLFVLAGAAALCLGPLLVAFLGRSRAWYAGTAWAFGVLSLLGLVAVASA